MPDTPDPNNPKPGDRFVGRFTERTMTVRYVDDDYVFGAWDSGTSAWSRRYQFGFNFTPAPPVWPEPPVRWGVQWEDGYCVTYYYQDAAESLVNDPDETCRLIRYVPEVVE